MAASYLFCLTADGGVPLYSRTKGDLKPLPFPVVGSLNGVHMFAANHDVSLLSTSTDDAKVTWKNYFDSVKLILVTRDDSSNDCHTDHLMDLVFHSMVLLYGLDDLTNLKNIERCKRELKVSYQLIDTVLSGPELSLFADVCNAADVIISHENFLLQEYLDTFVAGADSAYGCLFVHGKIAVATKKWWAFSPIELSLLALLTVSLHHCTSRDLPIFLPHTSPTVPHRLMMFHLIPNIYIAIISGPTPPLAHLQQEVTRFWSPVLSSLSDLAHIHPRNFPHAVPMDSNILGFVLVNTEQHKCLTCVEPQPEHKQHGTHLSASKRRAILRDFYKSTVGTFLPSLSEKPDEDTSHFSHKITDTYIVTESHKCYALQHADHRLFVLYTTAIPTFAMRSITQKTLLAFTKDKNHSPFI